MLLSEQGHKLDGWTVEILATDFSEPALRKAQEGVYTQFEVQRGLSVARLVRFFRKSGIAWRIDDELRRRVVFKEQNLLKDCSGHGRFDIVFCRNVLIYFDEQLKRAVLARLAQQLAKDGYLVLGAADTTTGLSADFWPVPGDQHGIFCMSVDSAELRRQARSEDAGATIAASSNPKPFKLDPATMAILEARAKARGLTLAELITEYAISGLPEAGDLPAHKAGRG
jgi:chemotaxis protein methyltransferase CheR